MFKRNENFYYTADNKTRTNLKNENFESHQNITVSYKKSV